MLQSNEEEGFAEDAPAEYAEYTYSPSLAFRDTHRRPYINPLKLKPNKPIVTTPEHYINSDLQQLLLSQFAAKHPLPHYRPTGLPIDGNLSFDSSFQSGNLEYVISSGCNTFDLFIKPDSNTMTHFQWFYFRVKNKRPVTVTLCIKNLLKQRMSYRDGLKPFHKSIAQNHHHYQQIPGNVQFGPSSQKGDMDFYELTFQYNFQFPNDEVEFSSQPPYPYSRYNKIYKCIPCAKIEISRTVLGNKIEAFLVNENINSSAIVVAMARQHPGESVGSWMMEGFVNRLLDTQNSLSWIIIPMVNIDGVILGNNRTGVQGYDFNRHWYIDQDTNRYHLFPELKGIIAYFQRKRKEYARKVKIFIDFHGHSSQQNVFAYGPPHYNPSQHQELNKVLPFLINQKNSNFSIKQCTYVLEPYKKNCSRSVFLHKFGFNHSYTIESSFGLYRGKRVNQEDMLKIGEDILSSVVDFANMLVESKDKCFIVGPLKEILTSLKHQNKHQTVQSTPKNGAYDSDSQNEDENAPIRRKFEQKLVMMLTKQGEQLQGSLFDRLAKKRNNAYLQRQYRQSKVNASTAIARAHQKTRLKTQQSRKTPQGGESHFLPRVQGERERKTLSTKKSVGLCDLDRLSLQEMKERLMKMKHSQLGRRILILDSHQST